MGFPNQVSEDALVTCGRSCCLCHKFCGNNMELHHIKQKADGGEDTFENCIPLCFDCHAIVKAYNPKHPKGRKITEPELIRHRDNWYGKIAEGLSKSINSKPNKLDYELYTNITQIFSGQNLEYYLTEFDLGGAFNNDVFNPLIEFVYKSNRPEFEFIDGELEKYKGALLSCVNGFLSYKATNTFPTGTGLQAIRCWHDNYDWYNDEDRKSVGEFNDLASAVWNSYFDLIRECRRIFANFEM